MPSIATILIAGLSPLVLAQTLVTELPTPQGTELASEPIVVSDSFDGGMKLYDRDTLVCQEQTETGEDDTIFILEDGASISNVIIGPNQAEGIHCKGSCTVTNVFWQDVCEDALTMKGDGTVKVVGGGAWSASDKIFQLNGFGTIDISYFYAEDFGKMVRSCGNCDGNGGPRNVIISNSVAAGDGPLCGINTNYGDTCTVTDTCNSDGKSCVLYEGNDTGDEPDKISEGPDGEYCVVENLTTDC